MSFDPAAMLALSGGCHLQTIVSHVNET